jgi:hypothetical protein
MFSPITCPSCGSIMSRAKNRPDLDHCVGCDASFVVRFGHLVRVPTESGVSWVTNESSQIIDLSEPARLKLGR